MNWFSIVGLIADLTGVSFLGFDLVRVQRRIRSDAAERLANFKELVESNTTFQKYATSLSESGDWREHDYDEGRMVPRGGFDYSAAQDSFKEAVEMAASVRDELSQLAELFMRNHQLEARNAGASLRWSYLGLLLIVAGFGLQIAGQF